MAGLYIHVPFCRHKCAYCDFYSTPDNSLLTNYPSLIVRELGMRRNEISDKFETVYLGGGTPSVLPDKALGQLFDGISRQVDIGSAGEITIEANPEDITPDRIRFYRTLGINRISIGIQSFNDDELAAVSRRHSASAALAALEALAQSGINFNADLIYGLPGQSVNAFASNLERLLSFSPPHVSAYLLSYEPGTRLYAQMLKGVVAEADETVAKEMYTLLCQRTSVAGYRHYEVSNFAHDGMRARHNSAYWNYTPYLGLGPSAHSFDGHTRRFNPAGIRKYADAIESGRLFYEVDCEDEYNRFNDYVITSLRTSDGFDLALAARLFGSRLLDEFMRNVNALPVGTLTRTESRLAVPERLWLKSDAVFRELIIG